MWQPFHPWHVWARCLNQTCLRSFASWRPSDAKGKSWRPTCWQDMFFVSWRLQHLKTEIQILYNVDIWKELEILMIPGVKVDGTTPIVSSGRPSCAESGGYIGATSDFHGRNDTLGSACLWSQVTWPAKQIVKRRNQGIKIQLKHTGFLS